MTILNKEREVKPWEPDPVGKLWMHRLDPTVRKVAEAAYNALSHVGSEHIKQQLQDSLKALEFDGSIGALGADAVKRGRDGEALSAADWNALAECAKALSEAEARERYVNVGPCKDIEK